MSNKEKFYYKQTTSISNCELSLCNHDRIKQFQIFIIILINGTYEITLQGLDIFYENIQGDEKQSVLLLFSQIILQILIIITTFLFSSNYIGSSTNYYKSLVCYIVGPFKIDKQLLSYFLISFFLPNQLIRYQTNLLILESCDIFPNNKLNQLKFYMLSLFMSLLTSQSITSKQEIKTNKISCNQEEKQNQIIEQQNNNSHSCIFKNHGESDIKNPNCSRIQMSKDHQCDIENTIHYSQIYNENLINENKLQQLLLNQPQIFSQSINPSYDTKQSYDQKFSKKIEQEILKNVKTGILLIDSNFSVVYCNQAIKKVFSTTNIQTILEKLLSIKLRSCKNHLSSSKQNVLRQSNNGIDQNKNRKLDSFQKIQGMFSQKTIFKVDPSSEKQRNSIINPSQPQDLQSKRLQSKQISINLQNQSNSTFSKMNSEEIECSIAQVNHRFSSKDNNSQLTNLNLQRKSQEHDQFLRKKIDRELSMDKKSKNKKIYASTDTDIKLSSLKINSFLNTQNQMKKNVESNITDMNVQFPSIIMQSQTKNTLQGSLQSNNQLKDFNFKQNIIPYQVLNIFQNEEVDLQNIIQEIFLQQEKMFQFNCWSQNDIKERDENYQNMQTQDDLLYYFENNDLIITFKQDQSDSYFTSLRIGVYHQKEKISNFNIIEKYILIEYFDQNKLLKSINEKEIFEYKNRMLASVSHELRTPLNCSIQMLQMLLNTFENISSENQHLNNQEGILLQQGIEEEMKEALIKPALQSNYLLLNIINDIVDYGQITTGKFQLAFAPLSILDIVSECADLIYFQATLKGIAIELLFDSNLPQVIHSDANRIRQVLLNLLSNSLKFTDKGQITIKVQLETSEVIRIEVQDTGCGIPEKNLQYFYETFGNKASSGSLNTAGAGLGMSIANNLAMGLGGNRRMEVKSTVGEGSSFSLFILNRSQNKQGCQYKLKDIFNKKLVKWESLTKEDTCSNSYSVSSSKQAIQSIRKGMKSSQLVIDSNQSYRTNTKSIEQPSFDAISNKTNIAVTNNYQQNLISVKMRPSLQLIESAKPKSGRSITIIPSVFSASNFIYDNRIRTQPLQKTNQTIPYNYLQNIQELDENGKKKKLDVSKFTQEVSIFDQNSNQSDSVESCQILDDFFTENYHQYEDNMYQSQFNYFNPQNIYLDQIASNKGNKKNCIQEIVDQSTTFQSQSNYLDEGKNQSQSANLRTSPQKVKEKSFSCTQSVNQIKKSNQNMFTFDAIPHSNSDSIEQSKQQINYISQLSLKEFKTELNQSQEKQNNLSPQNKMRQQSLICSLQNGQSSQNQCLHAFAQVNSSQQQNQQKTFTQSCQQEINKMIKMQNLNRNCSCTQILAVDDNDFNLYALEMRLKQYGFIVQKAISGFQAIEMVKSNFYKNTCCPQYKLIFMDIDMPLKDGHETTIEILKFFNQNKQKPPVISACSAYIQENEKKKAMQSGMTYYLTKPIDVNHLEQILFQIFIQQ